jgi:hypothetical protein
MRQNAQLKNDLTRLGVHPRVEQSAFIDDPVQPSQVHFHRPEFAIARW